MPVPSVLTGIPCPLCQEPLAMYVTTSRRGRHAIGLVCRRDGRHLRGFINDKDFVAATIAKIAEAAGLTTDEVVPPAPALEEAPEPPGARRVERRSRPS
jgi:hypothetical protein